MARRRVGACPVVMNSCFQKVEGAHRDSAVRRWNALGSLRFGKWSVGLVYKVQIIVIQSGKSADNKVMESREHGPIMCKLN